MDSGIVKQAGCNKQAGWKFFVKQLSKQDLIRASREEKILKIVKRACSAIRYIRVGTFGNNALNEELTNSTVTIA